MKLDEVHWRFLQVHRIAVPIIEFLELCLLSVCLVLNGAKKKVLRVFVCL